MGIIIFFIAIFVIGLIFGQKSDKKLNDEAKEIPHFKKDEAERYYKNFNYWNKRK